MTSPTPYVVLHPSHGNWRKWGVNGGERKEKKKKNWEIRNGLGSKAKLHQNRGNGKFEKIKNVGKEKRNFKRETALGQMRPCRVAVSSLPHSLCPPRTSERPLHLFYARSSYSVFIVILSPTFPFFLFLFPLYNLHSTTIRDILDIPDFAFLCIEILRTHGPSNLEVFEK